MSFWGPNMQRLLGIAEVAKIPTNITPSEWAGWVCSHYFGPYSEKWPTLNQDPEEFACAVLDKAEGRCSSAFMRP